MGEKYNYDISELSIPKQDKLKSTLSWKNSAEHQKLLDEKEKDHQKNKYKENSYAADDLIQLRSIITINNLNPTELIDELEKTKDAYSNMWKPKDEVNIFDKILNKKDSLFARGEEYFLGKEKICLISNIKVKSQAQLRIYQDKLIKKILGTDKGYNNEYIKGFMPEIGNYLMKIEDFESYIYDEDKKDINSLLLKSYIKYIVSIKDHKSINKLKKFLGSPLIKRMNDDNKGIINNASKLLGSLMKEIKEKITNLFDKITNFNDFNDTFTGLDKIEQSEMIKKLMKNKGKFIRTIKKSLSEDKSEQENWKIANDFVSNIIKEKNNPKQILLIIAEFKKQNDSSLDSKQLIEESGKIINNNNRTNIAIAIKEGKSKSVIEKIIKKAEKQEFISKKLNTLNNEQIESMTDRLQNGEVFNNIIQEIAQDNEELRDILDEEKENNEKYNSGVKSDENHENEVKEHSNYNIDEDDYIPSNLGYSVQLEHGENFPGLIITPEEKKATLGNPEALKNLIDFYSFFKDLNLLGVWKYRKELVLSMGDINIKLDDKNSISKVELIKFGKHLIKVINKLNEDNSDFSKLSESTGNISAVKNELRKYSGASSSLNNEQTYNILGEDKFTSQLRNKGIIGGPYFKVNKLRELTK